MGGLRYFRALYPYFLHSLPGGENNEQWEQEMIAQIVTILVAVSLLGHMAWGEIGVINPLHITSSTLLSLFTIVGNLAEVNSFVFPNSVTAGIRN